MPTVYPIVPGHEIVGRVTKVGSEVTISIDDVVRREAIGGMLSWYERRVA